MEFSYDEFIEIDEHAGLLLDVDKDDPDGACLHITQVTRQAEQVKTVGKITIPFRKAALVLREITSFVSAESHLLTPKTRFEVWTKRKSTATVPVPVTTGGKPAYKSEDPQMIAAVQAAIEPAHLTAKIPQSKFTQEDVIHQIHNQQRFSPPLNVPEPLLLPIIYYGFIGRGKMIARNVSDVLLKCNVENKIPQVRTILHQLASAGLITREEKTSKESGYTYYVFTFPSVAVPKMGE